MPRTKDEHTPILWTRVDAVVNLILENDRYYQSKRNSELTKMVIEKFGISERTAHRYIAEAKSEIRKLSKKNVDQAYIRAIRDREFLYRKAISPTFIFNKDLKDEEGNLILVADLKLALEVAKDRDHLQGLYVDEVNINGEVKNKIDLTGLTVEELRALANLKE